ncbi:ATP-binding cassette domain-containing protein [Herbiconiux sp. VKM Ac-2851]|uniref:ATP-binding cassette domain-containing protein n=1 Tax=Herbiconiux sp. VKM Ac-2851 TaxID=2739025 RepID=UPI001564F94B|nr:ATP-binding cassette domain-containing protein [Herbiconiux sp. VKM Ac-2851]NQX35021.1 ABC-F family ATP-binding cassette domain-containing protein [Herbiconiux sp. VKM Ac-2851]
MPKPSSTLSTPSIVLTDCSFAWPDGSVVLDHVSAAFGRRRTGLVGANGAGKSTLVRLITGDLEPTRGTVSTSGAVDLLPQRFVRGPDDTVADLLGVRERLDALQAVLAGDTDPRHLDALQDDWDVDTRAVAALGEAGLDLTADELRRPIATLSGGQAVLAAVTGVRLRGRPIAVLDEPTNNLDRRSRGILLDLVDRWPGVLVVVSHDRELLEHVDEVAELRDGSLRTFGGTWSAFEERLDVEHAAAERDLRAAEQVLRLERRRRVEAETTIARRAKAGERSAGSMPKILANTRRNRAEGTAGKLRSGHADAEARAREQVDAASGRVRHDDDVKIDLPNPGVPAARRLAEFTVRGRATVLQGPERLAIVGANGTGKTTLLAQLVGADAARPHPLPATGAVAFTDRIGWLPQHREDRLDDDRTVLEHIALDAPTASPRELRDALARLLIRGEVVNRPTGSLSGGERFRVALAGLVLARPAPELLVLDEPTNDLDLATTDHLVTVLRAWRGGLVVVSHDELFLDRLALDARLMLDAPTP